MNTSFKKHEYVDIPTKIQGIVFYSMLNRRHANPNVVKACEQAIKEVCKNKNEKDMLYEYVTTESSYVTVAGKHFYSVRSLERLFSKYLRTASAKVINL